MANKQRKPGLVKILKIVSNSTSLFGKHKQHIIEKSHFAKQQLYESYFKNMQATKGFETQFKIFC